MDVRAWGVAVVATCAFAMPRVGLAQPEDTPVPSSRLRCLRRRQRRFRPSRLQCRGRPSARSRPAPRFAWEPFGYLRLQYVVVQNDPNVAFVGRDDGFELQNARVGVRGTLERRARVRGRRSTARSTSARRSTSRRASCASACATRSPTSCSAARRGRVRGGYFQTLGRSAERSIPDTEREFVDKPLESRGMRATEGW